MTKIKKKNLIFVTILILLSFLFLILCMSYEGAEGFSWFAGFKMGNLKDKDSIALDTWSIILAGIGLSISGLAMQTLANNKLASAYSMGTIAGASLSMILVNYVIVPESKILGIFLNILFTICISSIIFLFTLNDKFDKNKIIAVGLIFSVFLSTVTFLLQFKLDITSEMVSFFSMESLSGSWLMFYAALAIITPCVILKVILAKRLWIYSTDVDKAITLGVRPKRLKIVISLLTMLIAVSCVIMGGLLHLLVLSYHI